MLNPAVPAGYVATLGVGINPGRSYRIIDATEPAFDHLYRSGLAKY